MGEGARVFGFGRHPGAQMLGRKLHGLIARVVPSPAMTRGDLTDAMIAETVRQVETVTCAPDDRCYAFPYQLADVRQRCTRRRRWKIGWIVTQRGDRSWEVWLDRHTGQGQPKRQNKLRTIE